MPTEARALLMILRWLRRKAAPVLTARERVDLWREYQGVCEQRLNQGFIEYGDRSFDEDLDKLLDEISQELADTSNWAFVGWVRVRRMRAALARARDGKRLGDDR